MPTFAPTYVVAAMDGAAAKPEAAITAHMIFESFFIILSLD
ncbi:hypothetical protein VCR4J5_1570071 [Vibrio crassostreae]|uniref:Uncharacterized protein n=1 Tax=Vibrio crassostreae TaxID=246167 RepID=A0A822MZJ5_9VIBR|nr:hypothetical protein VCRLGP8_10139 [Vibrio crassostreae]CDT12830.1 hypothetical protein VCR19J5_1260069 [Vibrio crassostreae]CDT16748.1 hypothetical protein VCR9J2_1620025 [Vibrio crassostreae]CDT17074.1 hypothetical protein VCR4J5_1570071 [Vibrio crassostreae]CDT28486.1 hypothetical protein VCRLGP107_410139 [Vibrio crassostreae]